MLWFVHVLASFANHAQHVKKDQLSKNMDEMMYLIGDFSIYVQLALANEYATLEKECRDKRGSDRIMGATNTAASVVAGISGSHGGELPSFGIGSAGFSGRGRGIGIGIRGGGRGAPESLHPMFGNSAKRRLAAPLTHPAAMNATTSTGNVNVTGAVTDLGNSSNAGFKRAGHVSASMNSTSATSTTTSADSITNMSSSISLIHEKYRMLMYCMKVQLICIRWIRILACGVDARNYQLIDGHHHHHLDHSMDHVHERTDGARNGSSGSSGSNGLSVGRCEWLSELKVKLTVSGNETIHGVQAVTNNFSIDWLMLVLGFQFSSVTRVSKMQHNTNNWMLLLMCLYVCMYLDSKNAVYFGLKSFVLFCFVLNVGIM